MATLGYARSSPAPGVESVADQIKLIEDFSRGLGRQVDGMYIDEDHSAGRLLLSNREAGKRLMFAVLKGDHIVVARLHRLCNSLYSLSRLLDHFGKLGVTLHSADLPRGSLDPGEPLGQFMVPVLARFAEIKRRDLSIRNTTTAAALKVEGRRCSRHAPFGWYYAQRAGRVVAVSNPKEQEICRQIARLRQQGWSLHRIRRFLAYEQKTRNRNGREFGYTEVRAMSIRGIALLRAEAQDA
jgi:DNA invertase Pin-like site-specific DNA recombinase